MALFRSLTVVLLSAVFVFAGPLRLEGATVLASGSSLVRTVAITFDDGPNEKLTPPLLDILDSLGVKVSFFLVGSMAEKNPGLVREIRSRGHTVANHSYSHRSCLSLSADELEEDILKCSAVLEALTSVPVRFFRPPGGKYDRKTVERVRKNGMKLVLWDINSRDYTGVSPSYIANRMVRRAVPGSILLFHSGVKATIDALPVIIDRLRKNGFEFVTLDEMFSAYMANALFLAGAAKVPFSIM
ncbi:polysaccharide deacetylase family protein [Aminivibrio sp.]|uniref:polysaccharide deacetylase family protein n=1 Tax=Aminivibrio sp. TaxID=1872489 RepID=UPI001A364ADD|nr:polysaccharide deacetylase family protein [Aminivibrio sp.]MBL3538433.1 polysaccharide deacetylase family protein [Aminivibrio sp.]MDK2958352.1 peptidoglycan-N-acetylglucosamine deacetylase [Synergistaceae bacterium]